MPEGIAVQRMFARIASRYDITNIILSFGLCIRWRNQLVAEVKKAQPMSVADLATGSGDIAIHIRRVVSPECTVVGFDFCEAMLAQGRIRAEKEGVRVDFRIGDCMQLPIADASQDIVTIAYGVRNFEDRSLGLAEMRRIVRPGGKVLILEFSKPSCWVAPFHFFHVRCVAPLIAGLLTGDWKAYRYLSTSIAAFPDASGLEAELIAAGFRNVRHQRMLLGTVALHEARI